MSKSKLKEKAYLQNKDALLKRLKRIEGQVRGIYRMIEEDTPCEDLVMQLSAVRAAVERVGTVVVGCRMQEVIRNKLEKGEEIDVDLGDPMKTFLNL